MNIRQMLIRIAELLMESDRGTKDWVSVPQLRHAWYLFCGCTLAFLASNWMGRLWFEPIMVSSAKAALSYRVLQLTLALSMQSCIFFLALRYYQFAISQKASIRFDNIVTFYLLSTLVFAFIYYWTFTIAPSWFIYHDPPYIIGSTFNPNIGIELRIRMEGEFILFSAFTSVNGSFYKVQAHSMFVGLLVYIQCLSTFALLGLFVALYVNQKHQQPHSHR
jgi:hypothetical protein